MEKDSVLNFWEIYFDMNWDFRFGNTGGLLEKYR